MQDAILKCVPIGANPYPGHESGLKATLVYPQASCHNAFVH
jgi:hypothetical protein